MLPITAADLHLLVGLLSIPVGIVIIYQFYQLYFSPLARFPGPKSAAISRLPFLWHYIKGDFGQWLHSLHEAHGPAVRIAPDELSFITSQAAAALNGKLGRRPFSRDPRFFGKAPIGLDSISQADDDLHDRFRRGLAPAFSDRALKSQEALIASHVDRLIRVLRASFMENHQTPVDIVRLYMSLTTDIMGDLVLGETPGFLDGVDFMEWAMSFTNTPVLIALLLFTRYLPVLAPLVNLVIPRRLRGEIKNREYFRDRLTRRLELKTFRPDFWGWVLMQNKGRLDVEDMHANTELLVFAGSETTSTLLGGLTYYLVANPNVLDRCVREVRQTFRSESDINMTSLTKNLPYTQACLEEGLRLHPSVPVGVPRLIPADGAWIDETFIPGQTAASFTQYAAYRSSANFRNPDKFAPERWLNDPDYDSDNRQVFQPFSFGSKGCLGKNLAYHEARLTLTKVLWHFDISLDSSCSNWANQGVSFAWEMPPLFVQVKPRPECDDR